MNPAYETITGRSCESLHENPTSYEELIHADDRVHVLSKLDEATRSGLLKALLSAYNEAFMAQVSQSVACNGLHRLEQRCCRWLLMTRDRVHSDDLRLTYPASEPSNGATRRQDDGHLDEEKYGQLRRVH